MLKLTIFWCNVRLQARCLFSFPQNDADADDNDDHDDDEAYDNDGNDDDDDAVKVFDLLGEEKHPCTLRADSNGNMQVSVIIL